MKSFEKKLLGKLIILAFISVFASMTSFHDTSYAATGNGTTKIGHITYAKGQVIVRTKGKWMILKETPWPIYSTDRVVTKSGRANITLVDGGVVRMNVDTSLRIVRKEAASGFLSSGKAKSTEVNVLVGNVWFQVELKRGRRIRFRTPSMTAAIRGTEGDFSVDFAGQTNLDLKSGSTSNSGNFTTLPGITDSKSGTALRPSSEMFLDSRQMLAVDSAVQQWIAAEKAAAKSAGLEQKADEASARENGSEPSRDRAARAALFAAVAQSNAAEVRAHAYMSVISEEVVSAETLRDFDNVQAARKSMEQARRSLATVVERNQSVRSMAESANFTAGAALTTILSSLVSTMASATDAHSASVRAYSMIVLAHSALDMYVTEQAETVAGKIQEDALNVDILRRAISAMLTRVSEGMDSISEQAVVTAAQAAAKAASVFAADAQSHANVVTEIVTGDKVSLETALEAEGIFVHLSARASALTRDLSESLEAGNLDLLIETLNELAELSDAADQLSGDGETPETLPETPVMDDLPEVEGEPAVEGAEEEEYSPVQDIPVLDPTQDTGGTGDRNVSPYTF